MKANFVKTFIPVKDFVAVEKVGNKMLVRFDAVEDADMDAYSCVEGSVSASEYNEQEMRREYEAWKKKWVEKALVLAKKAKIAEIAAYDTSDKVNGFMLGGKQMWLSFDERARIRQSIDAYHSEGRTEMTKWFNGKAFTFTLDTWQTMLNKLSVYASEALNVAERHKAEVKALTSIEAVEEYDYKTGYPKQLQFDNTSDAVITK